MPESTFYFNPFSLISFSSFLIMTILAILLWHKHYTTPTKFMVFLFVANAIYSFFYTFELSFRTIREITWFYQCEYIGIPFLSTFYLMYIIHYSGRSGWLTLKNKLLLFTIPVITLVMVFTNDSHNLFYSKQAMNLSGPFPTLSFIPAFWYYVHQTFVIITLSLSLFFLIKMMKNTVSIYNRQILFLLMSTLFPFIGYLACLMRLIPYGIDPVSFTFTLSGIIIYIAVFRFKLFEMLPIARSKLFEKIQDRVLVFDLNNRLIDYNQAASQQFNLSNKDLGRKTPELFSIWPEMMQFIQNNLSGKLEMHHLEGDISHFYDIHILELESSKKNKQGKLVVINDVSDLINTERERISTESKLNAVIQAIPDIILVIDKKGILTDFFATETENLFLNRDEVVGASLQELFNPEESEILMEFLADCLKSNALVTHQFMMIFPGEIKHYEVRLSKLDKTHVLAIIRDVSESVNMKQDLLYQSGFQRILMNLASRFIYIPESETDSVISDSLRQIGEYTGVERSYIFRYNFENGTMTNTHEWCSESATSMIRNRQNTSIQSIMEWLDHHQRGEPTWVNNLAQLKTSSPLRSFLDSTKVQSVITIPMISQKNCLGFVGFDTIHANRKWNDSDISSLKIFTGMLANLQEKISLEKSLVEAKIKAEASNQLKTAFMNNISHEIRTPLNGIIGFGEIIANEQLSLAEKNKFLAVVQESSERLIHTIDDYIDISILVTGNQEIYPKHFKLSQLIEEVIEDFTESILAKKLNIYAEVPIHLKQTTLYSDPELIRKILNHLVGNSLKFTERGNIHIGMHDESGKVTLYVQDTGIGIAENAQKIIFDSFMQEDFSSTRMYEGSGLGLSIVKGIVTLLGGEIKVSSTKGKGSRFNITFPTV